MRFIVGIVLGLGIAFIYRVSTSRYNGHDASEDLLPVNRNRSTKKEQNLRAVLRLFRDQPRIRNHDVQELLDVSPKTARNYFDELETDGLILQHGTSGRDVYYVRKQ